MKTFKLSLAILAVTVLVACAKPTAYRPADAPGSTGYSEKQIGTDQFRISFAGNGITTRKTVDLYLLYRAAELTKERGFRLFHRG